MTARNATDLNYSPVVRTKASVVKLVATRSTEVKVCRAIMQAPARKRTHLVCVLGLHDLGNGTTAIVMERLDGLGDSPAQKASDSEYDLMHAQLRALGWEQTDSGRYGHNVMWDAKRKRPKLIDFDHVRRVSSAESSRAADEVVTLRRTLRSKPKPPTSDFVVLPPVQQHVPAPAKQEWQRLPNCKCEFCNPPAAPQVHMPWFIKNEMQQALDDDAKKLQDLVDFGLLERRLAAPGALNAPVREVPNQAPPF